MIIVIVTLITVHLACFILFNRLIQAMANINKMCCDGAAQVPMRRQQRRQTWAIGKSPN
jgi:hypothetical protein